MINFQACYVEDEDSEGQVQLICACDRLIDRFYQMFDFSLSSHGHVPAERAEMKNSRLAEFLQSTEGRSVSREAIESLRLLKMFIKLTPAQRREIIELVEQYLQH